MKLYFWKITQFLNGLLLPQCTLHVVVMRQGWSTNLAEILDKNQIWILKQDPETTRVKTNSDFKKMITFIESNLSKCHIFTCLLSPALYRQLMSFEWINNGLKFQLTLAITICHLEPGE